MVVGSGQSCRSDSGLERRGAEAAGSRTRNRRCRWGWDARKEDAHGSVNTRKDAQEVKKVWRIFFTQNFFSPMGSKKVYGRTITNDKITIGNTINKIINSMRGY